MYNLQHPHQMSQFRSLHPAVQESSLCAHQQVVHNYLLNRCCQILTHWYGRGLVPTTIMQECNDEVYSFRNTINLIHNFFLSLLLLIRCILSLSQAFFKQYRIKNIWSPPGIE